jgi:defect-in-organelle-trafficking protein DotC
LPTTDAEREIWKKAVAAGWKAGIEQADQGFKINMNRLTRDYRGMVNYHILALRKMVTLPIVAHMEMPLNSRGDTMTMGETVLRLTALPTFDANMKKWRPLAGEDDRVQMPGDIPAASVRAPTTEGGAVAPVARDSEPSADGGQRESGVN